MVLPMKKVVRVLVIDDSAYVRKVIKQMLSRSPFIEVVGTARDGAEGLEKVRELNPDVVTCDLIMPEVDGIGFLREQMSRKFVPVVIVSIANESGELALSALDAGAIDIVQKPTALATEKVFEVSDELIEKVKAAAAVEGKHLHVVSAATSVDARPLSGVTPSAGLIDMIVLGISTGGPAGTKVSCSATPGRSSGSDGCSLAYACRLYRNVCSQAGFDVTD